MAQCPCPINVKDPRAKHSSVRLVVPCTKCPICLQNRRTEWSIRLGEELRTAKNAWFLTLTYSDENIPINEYGLQTLRKTDVQKFHKRLWQKIDRYKKKANEKWPKFRYYAVGEYGTKTNRPHYHAIYYNIPRKIMEQLETIWGEGHIKIGSCNPSSIHYVTKYMINKETPETHRETPKSIMSLKPALGAEYLKRNDAWHVHNAAPYMIKDGKKVRMPRYYKDKIFTESEKIKMAETYQKIADTDIIKSWEQAKNRKYDYDEDRIRKIEDKFRKIRKQSKSD